MSLLNKIKSVFIIPDEGASNNSSAESATTGNSQGAIQTSPEIKGKADPEGSQKFFEILSQVIEKNNQPGFDYIEYKRAVKSILDMHQMEESAAWKTAFVTAQAMNVQSSSLLDSAKKYLSILNTEQVSFSQSATNFLQAQLSARKNEQEQLKSEIQSLKTEIEKLSNLLESKEKRQSQISGEMTQVQQRFENNKLDFDSAFKMISKQIEEDIQKIQQYLS